MEHESPEYKKKSAKSAFRAQRELAANEAPPEVLSGKWEKSVVSECNRPGTLLG
jgi:hypothetical protein